MRACPDATRQADNQGRLLLHVACARRAHRLQRSRNTLLRIQPRSSTETSAGSCPSTSLQSYTMARRLPVLLFGEVLPLLPSRTRMACCSCTLTHPRKTTSVDVIQVLSEASAMHTAARPVDLTPLLLAALPSSCNTHVSKARCIAALWICKADASTPGCAPIKPQHTCEQTQVYCSAPMTPLLLAALHYGHTGWVEQQHTREQSPGALQRALWICKADASALGCAPLRSHIVG